MTVGPAGDGKARKVAQAAIKLYGLNRPELRQARWRVWRELQILLESRPRLSGRLHADVEGEIREMTSPSADFTAMCRFVVRRWPKSRVR